MTRFFTWAALATLFCTSCMSAGPKNVATKAYKEGIQGTWKWVSVMDQGMEMPWPDGNRLVITSDLVTMVYPKDDSKGWRYTIDSSKSPKEMDWFPEEEAGHPILNPAIYSLDGDTLRICSTAAGKPRPTEFESKKGDFGGLWVLKRVAPATTELVAK